MLKFRRSSKSKADTSQRSIVEATGRLGSVDLLDESEAQIQDFVPGDDVFHSNENQKKRCTRSRSTHFFTETSDSFKFIPTPKLKRSDSSMNGKDLKTPMQSTIGNSSTKCRKNLIQPKTGFLEKTMSQDSGFIPGSINSLNGIHQQDFADLGISAFDRSIGTPNKLSKIPRLSPKRPHWTSQFHFIIVCLSFTLGVRNIVQFPLTALENGGMAFIAAYILVVVFVSYPVVYFLTSLGQFVQSGSLNVWKIFPITWGIGAATVLSAFITLVFNTVNGCYSIIYIYFSFQSTPVWLNCLSNSSMCHLDRNMTSLLLLSNCSSFAPSFGCHDVSVRSFWLFSFLNASPQTDLYLGSVSWQLSVGLALTYVCAMACHFKGPKMYEKVALVTSTLPIVFILALFVRALIRYLSMESHIDQGNLLYGDWNRFSSFEFWSAVCTQGLFNLILSCGVFIVVGSYNSFNTKVHLGTFCVCLLEVCISVIAYFTITFIGLSNEHDSIVNYISETEKVSHLDFAFTFMAEKLYELDEVPQLWSFLFFAALFLFEIGTVVGLVESLVTSFCDMWPQKLRRGWLLTAVYASAFLLGIPFISQRGPFLRHIFDACVLHIPTIFIVLCSITSIAWLYGMDKYSEKVEVMTGSDPRWVKLLWLIVTPFLLTVILIISLAQRGTEVSTLYDIEYPAWMLSEAWFFVIFIVLLIPSVALVQVALALFRGTPPRRLFIPISRWQTGTTFNSVVSSPASLRGNARTANEFLMSEL